MKKLQRYTFPKDTTGLAITHGGGAYVRYDDAMQALADRQSVLDARTKERDALLTCVEVADEMRAFLEDYRKRVGDIDPVAKRIAKAYDDTRRRSMQASPDAQA